MPFHWNTIGYECAAIIAAKMPASRFFGLFIKFLCPNSPSNKDALKLQLWHEITNAAVTSITLSVSSNGWLTSATYHVNAAQRHHSSGARDAWPGNCCRNGN